MNEYNSVDEMSFIFLLFIYREIVLSLFPFVYDRLYNLLIFACSSLTKESMESSALIQVFFFFYLRERTIIVNLMFVCKSYWVQRRVVGNC